MDSRTKAAENGLTTPHGREREREREREISERERETDRPLHKERDWGGGGVIEERD